jgi:hypothetical protein
MEVLMATARSKSAKGSDLPEVAVDESIADPAPVSTESKASAAGNGEVDRLKREVGRLDTLAMSGLVAAALAFFVALFSPIWATQFVANDAASVRASLLAAAQVRGLADGDRPFAGELALIAKAVPSRDKEMTALFKGLEGVAKTGAPTKDELAGRFAGMADNILVGKVMGKDEGWMNWTASKVASAVRLETVVSTVGPEGTSPETKVAREAEQDLAKGDLKAAVTRLESLNGTPAQVVAGWMEGAKRRLALDAQVSAIESLAVTRSTEGARLSFN